MKKILFVLPLLLACMSAPALAVTPTAETDAVSVDQLARVVVTSAPSLPVADSVEVCGAVNVRAGAAPIGGVLRWLSPGDVVTVYERRNGWARIGAAEWIVEDMLCKE